MIEIEHLFARISDNPLRDAFEVRVKKTLPSVAKPKSMHNMAAPAWDGGSFESFAEEAFMATAEKPLALYVHVPFCHHQCTFCPFYINKTFDEFSSQYSNLLSKEITTTAQILQNVIQNRSVKTIYFGGGTPSDMEGEDLAKIIRQLHNTFNIASDAEITVEGRVQGFTADKAKLWLDAGATRFSLGVQTTDTKLRKKLSRQSDRETIAEILNGLCGTGGIVVADIMYGLPGQTPDMLVEDIRFLAEETGIHGLDLYELKVFPDSALDKAIQKGSMPPAPSVQEQATMFGSAYEKLLSYGFENFSAKHWRRDIRERSIYNSLAKRQTDMIPFGSGGGGRLGQISLGVDSNYSEYEKLVSTGVKPLKRIMKTPAPKTHIFAQELNDAFDQLRVPISDRWPESLRPSIDKVITQWQSAGLVTQNKDEQAWRLSCAGTFWAARMNTMLSDFINTEL